MDPTMRQLIKDVVRLRKEVGITQQDVSALAGEPCRTFLAHLEQGRKTHLNLRKLYGVLHVLFSKTKGEKMSQAYVTQEMLDQALATLRAEFSATKSAHAPKAPRVLPEKAVPPQFEPYVDEIIRQYTVERPVDTQEVLHKLKKRADAGELYSGNRHLKIQEGKYVKSGIIKLRGAAIEQYIQINGKMFTGLNTPDKFPEVKFIRLDPAVNAPNPHYPWPAVPVVVPATPTTALADGHHLPQPRNQLLTGLTQEETDYAMATFGHGVKRDAGWLYIAHPILVRQLSSSGSTTKEAIHRCTHRDIEVAEAATPDRRTPTKQSHECVSAYLMWLSGLELIHVEKRGNDLIVSRASNSRLTPEPLAHLKP